VHVARDCAMGKKCCRAPSRREVTRPEWAAGAPNPQWGSVRGRRECRVEGRQRAVVLGQRSAGKGVRAPLSGNGVGAGTRSANWGWGA
jgi:hypothetical protein